MCTPCRTVVGGIVTAVWIGGALAICIAAFAAGGYVAKAVLWIEGHPGLPPPLMLTDSEFWTLDDTWFLWGALTMSSMLVPLVGAAVLFQALRWTGWTAWALATGRAVTPPGWARWAHRAYTRYVALCGALTCQDDEEEEEVDEEEEKGALEAPIPPAPLQNGAVRPRGRTRHIAKLTE